MRLRTKRKWRGLSPALGLLLLSALWAISSMSTDLFPHASDSTLLPVLRQAALFSLFAILAGSIALVRGFSFPRGRLAFACMGVGLGLFVIPSAVVFLVQGTVSTLDRIAIFSLTPVFAAVLQPYLQDGPPERGKAALAGSICAVAGILLLFPLDIPGSFRAGAGLCAIVVAMLCIAAANCFAVRLARRFAGGSILPMASQAAAASAVCFAVAGVFAQHPAGGWPALPLDFLFSAFTDIPALFLLFWLMRRLAASRMTARFVLAPLFTVLAGTVVQPESPTARAWLGIVLLAAGAGWLVFAPAEPSEGSELSPLAGVAEPCQRPPSG